LLILRALNLFETRVAEYHTVHMHHNKNIIKLCYNL